MPRPFSRALTSAATLLAVCLLPFAFCLSTHAQQFSIDWHTIAGGGGTSTGGVLSVSGTIGQHDAGAMSGGSLSLTGGFWSLFSAVQTPGAPLLTIRQNTNYVITTEWPRPADGWTLERTAAFGTNAAATVWTLVPPPYQANATHHFLTTNAPPGHNFFRLRKLATAPVNVLLSRPVTLNGAFGLEGLAYVNDGWSVGVLASGSTLTDGAFLSAGHQMDQGTVWWDSTHPNSATNSIEIALGGSYLINNLVVQADDNDTYRIKYFDGAAWNLAWDIPAVGGWGMQTRGSGILTPFTASAIRFSATGGDDIFAVSEIQAWFIPAP